ncbi:ras family-domain-containing protein [Mycena alexandri]|uniref:Ras family-domain-containing protein n=1 Tax=Mycena alexandri TaxID=1745969 RepID=A0AAD6SN11_9AGAR|nr:ras family-domain-containing protein [Mycena alexandri]
MASPPWHYVLKFIITGDAAVGKSSLLVRLTDQRFLANPDPTLGVEFGSKLITLPGPDPQTVVKLQCWDTAGTESFRSITRSYYRGAAGALLVYSITSLRSFESVRTWLADVRAHADAHVSCVLVGNKRDLAEGEDAPAREVPTALAQQFADEEGLLFTEASARSGEGVEEAFIRAAEEVLRKVRAGRFDDSRSPGVKLSKPGAVPDAGEGGGEGGGKGGQCCT